jgi:hypothetical protein
LVLSSVHWVRSELVAVAEPVEDAAANSVPVRFAKAGAGIRGIFSRADSFLDLPCAPTKGGRSRRHPMRRGLAGRQHAAMPGDDPVLAVDSPSFERDSR